MVEPFQLSFATFIWFNSNQNRNDDDDDDVEGLDAVFLFLQYDSSEFTHV